MKQEASKKKSKLWLWLVIGVVALLAVAGVVLALVLGSGNNEPAGPTGGRPELYWNIDKKAYTENSQSGLSTREPGEDGLYHVRFAYGGEVVELPVVDKQLINYIDTLDAMGIVMDADGVVVDVKAPTEIATEVGKNIYVKSVQSDKIIANSSLAMNGMPITIELGDLTEIYDVTPGAEEPGKIMDVTQLKTMDAITVYGNDLEENTHVYVTSHPKESKVYWRASQSYNSSLKETAREPDENGAYSMDFFCEGELVTLKTKDKAIATKVDSMSRWKCHFAFSFDEEGYITEYFSSALGISGMLVADGWDVVSMEGDYVTLQRLTTNDGSTWSGTIPADCVVYDASPAAKSEKRGGGQVDGIQMGDRVTVWTDTNGTPILIYVGNRIVDSPAYWVPTRKYSSAKKETTREPNARGYYEVELLREGDNEKKTYYIKDKETMSYLDSQTSKCVGLKVGEGNVIEYVYDSESLTGYTCRTKGGIVSAVTGSIITKIAYGKPDSAVNYVLTPDCRIYNVSTYGKYGEKTTLQEGDHIYGYAQATGELVLVFITKRTIGADTLYYNLERLYDSETKTTTREPDADGWYVFTFAHDGKQVTLKTKDKDLATLVDKQSPGAVALEVSGDIITAAYDPGYAYGGNKVASGYRYRYVTDEGLYHCVYNTDTSKTTEFKMADDCIIYNVSPVFKEFKGEQIYSLQYNDMLTVYCDWKGEAKVVYVRYRDVDNMYWKTEKLYDDTNKVTKRVPDADGYYWYNLAVNGEVKSFKTKDQKVANSMDSYDGAFGLSIKGENEIIGFVSSSYVKNVKGNSVIGYNVTKIEGNTVTVTYNKPGSSYGTTKTIKLSSSTKIYDVSPTAEKFGAEVKLQVGDTIRSYLSRDEVTDAYVYIQAHSTRKGGEYGYCEVCGKDVTWNPVTSATFSKYDGHWYLTGDTVSYIQQTHAVASRDYTICLDLNGHTLTRSDNGRMFRISEGETLNIFDSVGGGKIVATGGNGYSGGMMMISKGGKVNLYSGTLEMLESDYKNGNGGNVYITDAESVFSMYGGQILNGSSYAKSATASGAGGNVYVSKGTFNMYGGTVAGGESYGGKFEVEEDGKTVEKTAYGYGGNIYLSSGAKVNITGGTVTGGYSELYGGNIYLASSTGTLNVSNATISDGHARRGGNIYGIGTNTLTGATISGGVAEQHGGNIQATNGTWLINGGTKILGGHAGTEKYHGHGGNISMYAGVMTIEKATIDGGVAGGGLNGNGGNIYIYQDSAKENTLNICEGAVISNGSAAVHAGSIYVSGAKKITEKVDGVDVDNYYVPTLNISGGQITGGVSDTLNLGSGYGGNIYIGGNLNLTGGSISGGSKYDGTPYDIYIAATRGDVVVTGGSVAARFRVYSAESVALSGTPSIGELNLAKTVVLSLGEMKDGADVSVVASHVFTEPCENAQAYVDAEYIKAYDPARIVEVTAEKALVLSAAPVPTRTAPCYCAEHNGADAVWVDLNAYEMDISTSGSKILPAGHFYLSDNFNPGEYQVNAAVSGDDGASKIVLDLNGKTWTTNNKRGLLVYGELSIYDNSTEKTGVLSATGKSGGHGGVVMVSTKGIVNLHSGTLKMLESDWSVAQGGVATVSGIFNMYGGTLTGGDVVTYSYNGKDYTTAYGGAVYLGNDAAEFNMYDGEITGNTAETKGDAIYVAKGKLNVAGGSISGDVYAGSAPTSFTVSGEPVIELLDLTQGTIKVTVGELTGNASITVKAESGTVITEDNANTNDFKDFFHNADSTKYISVVASGNSLALAATDEPGGEVEIFDPNAVYEEAKAMDFSNADATTGMVKAVCPVCGGEEVEWYPLPAVNDDTVVDAAAKPNNRHVLIQDDAHHHYYLDPNVDYDANTGYYSIKGTDVSNTGTQVCLNLNGQSITSTKRAFFTESKNTVLNVMGDGSVSGNGNSSLTTGVFDGTAQINLYGGTYESTDATAPVIDMRSSYAWAILNVYEGTTIQTGTCDYALYVTKNSTINICGGTVTGGSVYADKDTATLTVSGKPVIGELELANGALLSVDALTNGASITVNAEGVFTNDITDPTAVKGFFHAAQAEMLVEVEGSALAVKPAFDPNEVYAEAKAMDFSNADADGKVTAKCPVCGSDKDWYPLEPVTGKSLTKGDGEHYHYYLGASKDYTANTGYYYIKSGTKVCVNLNGQTVESTNRAFVTESENTVLNIMGDGTVRGAGIADREKPDRGVLDATGVMNLYGGIYECTTSHSPVLAVRSNQAYCVVSMYEGTNIRRTEDGTAGLCVYVRYASTFNVCGGSITGGDTTANDAMLGGNIMMEADATSTTKSWHCALNISGGTISGGKDAKGGNIYVLGTDYANHSTTINISGGAIENGSVYVTGDNASLNISGTPVIGELDMTGTVLTTVADLEEGADITVTAADGVAFTNPIAQNAETYATYFHGTALKTGGVINSENALMIGNVCPHCGVAMTSITWTDIANTDKKYSFAAGGHYRLAEDFNAASGNAFTIPEATSTTGLDVVLDTCGFDITAVGGRCFYIAKYNRFTLFDSVGGSVATSTANNAALGGSGLVAYANTEVDIYDLTINGSANAFGRGNCLSVYSDTTVVNVYSGTFNGNTNDTAATGGTVYNHGTLNIYGGTFNDSVLPNGLGSCVYSDATLNVAGGTLNGDVYVAAGDVELSGNAVIASLQLVSGVKATLGELTEGADVTVTAEGVFTAANENAQAYVDAQYIKAADGKVISVNTDNTLSMAAATTLQLLAKAFNLLCASII